MTFQRVAGGRWRPRCRRSPGQQCVSAELNYYLGGGGCSQHSHLTCFLIRSQPAEGTKGPGCGSPLHAPLLSLQEQCPEREAWIKRPSSDTGSPVPAPPTPARLAVPACPWGVTVARGAPLLPRHWHRLAFVPSAILSLPLPPTPDIPSSQPATVSGIPEWSENPETWPKAAFPGSQTRLEVHGAVRTPPPSP